MTTYQVTMLSVIIPVYNEAATLRQLQGKLIDALESLGTAYEIIFIDDCSTDQSPAVLKEIARSHQSVRVISLARNFGQTQAIQAGFDHARGDVITILDADLQNDPADIHKLLLKIKEGFDVVSGWRKQRKDPLLRKRIPSYLGNSLICLFFKVKLHDIGCALKMYRRDVISHIRLYGEMHRLLPLYAAMRGAAIAEVEVSHCARPSGRSHYGWERAFKVILDLITVRFFETYSTKPIYFFGGAGFAFIATGAILGIFVIVRALTLSGIWVSPLLFISLMFFMMGVGFIFMGLLAEIIIRIYYNSPSERAYVIKEIINKIYVRNLRLHADK